MGKCEIQAMGSVHRFRPRAKRRPPPFQLGRLRHRCRRWRVLDLLFLVIAIPAGIAIGSALFEWTLHRTEAPASDFACASVKVTDGDTLRCDSKRVRLTGIDPPELPEHFRAGRDCTPGDPDASTNNLQRLVGLGPVHCNQTDIDVYGRIVARCSHFPRSPLHAC
jgi:endonuclease YncB( thermonuclease family)